MGLGLGLGLGLLIALVAMPDSVNSSKVQLSCYKIISKLLLDLSYGGTIKVLNTSLRSAWQCKTGLALGPSGESLSTELWILLASLA